MKHDKLVRDEVPEIIRKNGGIPVTHTAEEKEYWNKLVEKLQEEVDEFKKDPSEEELADVLEVIKAICTEKKLDKNQLEELRKRKAIERGSFSKKIILDETG